MLAGAGAVCTSACLFVSRQPRFYKGLALPLIAVGLMRMKAVLRNFMLYRWIELTLSIIGAARFLASGRRTALRGAGLGRPI